MIYCLIYLIIKILIINCVYNIKKFKCFKYIYIKIKYIFINLYIKIKNQNPKFKIFKIIKT